MGWFEIKALGLGATNQKSLLPSHVNRLDNSLGELIFFSCTSDIYFSRLDTNEAMHLEGLVRHGGHKRVKGSSASPRR